MRIEEKEAFIHRVAEEHVLERNEKIMWSLHAVKKLRSEGYRKMHIEESLKKCTIIEDYTMEGRLLPGCLTLGYFDSEPVHVVVAIDRDWDRIFIITVYKPSADRWSDDWKKRKI